MTDTTKVSASRTIEAPASAIFDLLADPSRHQEIDGSSTVRKGHSANPARLSLGARFSMDMSLSFLPYRIGNEVVAFEENREIRWRHFGHHEWGYQLEAESPTATLVTETFDWTNARLPASFYRLVNFPEKNLASIVATLQRLEEVVT